MIILYRSYSRYWCVEPSVQTPLPTRHLFTFDKVSYVPLGHGLFKTVLKLTYFLQMILEIEAVKIHVLSTCTILNQS